MAKTTNKENLKLIYIHKIGYNFKGETLLEFLFSEDETNIDADAWHWNDITNDTLPPSVDYVDEAFQVKISEFDLYCLHEANDRPYMHGYNMIHALAYEVSNEEGGMDDDYGMGDDDDTPLLVFHYGFSYNRVRDMLNGRNIQIK